jgi:hypothetical protein
MIYGINPLTISYIGYVKFRRHGYHPLYAKVMCKKNPISGFFGLYENGLFDGCYKPQVRIYGSNRDVLKIIECRSNDHARQLRDELNDQLADWVEKMKDSRE